MTGFPCLCPRLIPFPLPLPLPPALKTGSAVPAKYLPETSNVDISNHLPQDGLQRVCSLISLFFFCIYGKQVKMPFED